MWPECMNQIELSTIIDKMLSANPERELAEAAFTEIMNRSPFDLIQYFFSLIESNPENDVIKARNLTLLTHVFRQSDKCVYEVHIDYITKNLCQLLTTPTFDEPQRDMIVALFSVVFCYVRFPELSNILIQVSTSPDDLISSSAIEIIACGINQCSIEINYCFENLLEIIMSILNMNQFSLRLISAVKLIVELFPVFPSIQQLAPNLLNCFAIVPLDRSYKFFINILNIPVSFFEQILDDFILTASLLISQDNYPPNSRLVIIEYFTRIFHIKRYRDFFFKNSEKIIQSITNLFMEVENNDAKHMFSEGQHLLFKMSGKNDNFDTVCCELIKKCITSQDWHIRYAGIRLFESIIANNSYKDLENLTPLVIQHVEDPIHICRKISYKLIKRISNERSNLLIQLHMIIFKEVLETIPRENEPYLISYGFKVLAKLCFKSGSEILMLYGDAIFQLITPYSSLREDIQLQISIIKCIGCLSNSLQKHLSPEMFNGILLYFLQMAQIDNILLRYNVVLAIPSVCMTNERNQHLELALMGVNLFLLTNIENLGEKKQIKFFDAFRKLVKIVGVQNVPSFNEIIQSLLIFANTKIEYSFVDIDFDKNICSGKIGIIKLNNNRNLLIFSWEKQDQISDSIILLAKYIHKFPENFLPFLPHIFEIVQLHLKSMNEILTLETLKLLKKMIKVSNILNISAEQFYAVIDIKSSFQSVEKKIISLIKCIILKYNDPININPGVEIVFQILNYSRNNQAEYMESIKQDADAVGLQDLMNESSVETAIARFFEMIIEKFPIVLNEGFISFLDQNFSISNPVGSFIAPKFIIETALVISRVKEYQPIIEACLQNVTNENPEPRKLSLISIGKLMEIIDNQQHIALCLQGVVAALKDEDADDIDFDEATDEALFTMVCILRRYPQLNNEELMKLFLGFLPVNQRDKGEVVHSFFATELKTKPSFYKSQENIEQTLMVVAKTCNGHLINSETRKTFQQFVRTLFSPADIIQIYITDALNRLQPFYVTRLQNFTNLNLSDYSRSQPNI